MTLLGKRELPQRTQIDLERLAQEEHRPVLHGPNCRICGSNRGYVLFAKRQRCIDCQSPRKITK